MVIDPSISSLVLTGLLSCNIISTYVAPDHTETHVQVSQDHTITDIAISEKGVSPVHSISALVPVWSGVTDLQGQLEGFLP